MPDDVAENIAANKCKEINGLPIIIHDDEVRRNSLFFFLVAILSPYRDGSSYKFNMQEQAYWKSRATGAYDLVLGANNFWLNKKTFLIPGLVCSSSRWMWADGSQVDYHPPSFIPSEILHDEKNFCFLVA